MLAFSEVIIDLIGGIGTSVSTEGLAAVQVTVDAGIELVGEVGAVRTSSTMSWASARVSTVVGSTEV